MARKHKDAASPKLRSPRTRGVRRRHWERGIQLPGDPPSQGNLSAGVPTIAPINSSRIAYAVGPPPGRSVSAANSPSPVTTTMLTTHLKFSGVYFCTSMVPQGRVTRGQRQREGGRRVSSQRCNSIGSLPVISPPINTPPWKKRLSFFSLAACLASVPLFVIPFAWRPADARGLWHGGRRGLVRLCAGYLTTQRDRRGPPS